MADLGSSATERHELTRAQLNRIALFGFFASGLAFVLGVGFLAPLIIVGVLGFPATVLTVAVRSALSGAPRWPLFSFCACFFVWLSSAVAYWWAWGRIFDLLDASRPVPAWLRLFSQVSAIVALAAFLASAALAVVVLVQARRMTRRAAAA